MNKPMEADIVRMQLSGDRLVFVLPGQGRTLEAGSLESARELLRHRPVTAGELEALIEIVEDHIMPSMRLLEGIAGFEASAAELGDVARALLAEAGDRAEVGIDDVEDLFNALADVASGSPAGAMGIPVDGDFALRLVLLREVMHHGGFGRVSLLA